MCNVNSVYNNGNLLIRAEDLPRTHIINGKLSVDCSTWANEFALMAYNNFNSVSSTLLIPGVPVQTYKNVGFLVDGSKANCHHIALTDSVSAGNISEGTFIANKANFNTLSELANFIKNNNHSVMNEVNMNLNLDAVIGLVFLKCPRQELLLKNMLLVQACIKDLTGTIYPIYEYDSAIGKISEVTITYELYEKLNGIPNALGKCVNDYDYYTEYSDSIYYGSISKDNLSLK